MEYFGKRSDLDRRTARMASRRRGGHALLTAYFITANIALIATNLGGLSPLAAILLVWLGGGVVSVFTAIIASSVTTSDFRAMVGSFWRNEYVAEIQRS